MVSIEYGQYGEMIAFDGQPGSGITRTNIARACPMLFSTKYLDSELAPTGGLYYYGYRYAAHNQSVLLNNIQPVMRCGDSFSTSYSAQVARLGTGWHCVALSAVLKIGRKSGRKAVGVSRVAS